MWRRALLSSLFLLIALVTLAAPGNCYGQEYAPGLDSYADLGNPDDERFHDLQGWGDINPGLLPKGYSADRTSRYQSLGGSNSVRLLISHTGVAHGLTFRAEAGLCDDSFEIFVNGSGPLYTYRHLDATGAKSFHHVKVDAALIAGTTVEVTFRNIAGDGCGRAAVYYVALEPLAEAGILQPPSSDVVAVSLQRALEIAEDYLRQKKVDLGSYTLVEAKLSSCDEKSRCWRLRWARTSGESEDGVEIAVSMQGETVHLSPGKPHLTGYGTGSGIKERLGACLYSI